jgi:hypothetical protein
VEFILPGVPDVRSNLAAKGISADPDAIWLDLSLFDNDFAPGTFLNAGPFAAAADGRLFGWFGLADRKTHFYRLNAHVGLRWVELGRGSFETPDCSTVNSIVCDRRSGANTVDFVFAKYEAQLPPGVPVPPLLTALQSWIDLSLQDNDFLPGTFLGARTSPAPSAYGWSGLAPGLRHYYRLNTLWSDGRWDGGRSIGGFGSFVSLRCDGLPALPPPTV